VQTRLFRGIKLHVKCSYRGFEFRQMKVLPVSIKDKIYNRGPKEEIYDLKRNGNFVYSGCIFNLSNRSKGANSHC